MVAIKTAKGQDRNTLLTKAADLHGHMGPFLALGVRLGLMGLKELGAKEGDARLKVTVMLNYVTPISCILDGVQTATKCTVGNKRLDWKESKEVAGAMFLLRNSKRQVKVIIDAAVVQELKRRLGKMPPMAEEVRQLASEIFSRPDEELFLIKHK